MIEDVSVTFDVDPMISTVAADAAARRFPDREQLWTVASQSARRHVLRFVRHLSEAEPETYGLFASENELMIAIFDCLDGRCPPCTVDDIVDALRSSAQARWVISTPLINVYPPEEVVAIDHRRAIAPTLDEDSGARRETANRLRDVIGAAVQVGERWDRYPNEASVDTRHTASVVSLEQGSKSTAEKRAMTVARLALATWTLLSPPDSQFGMALWPSATEWQPQPHLHVQQRSRRLDVEGDGDRGATIVYGDDGDVLYRLPSEPVRGAPFRAVERASTSYAASALLSASWNLYLAARTPTDLMWLDRLLMIMHAREALCAPPSPSRAGALTRWKTAIKRLGVIAHMQRNGWTQTEIAAISRRGWDLRTLGAHTGDGALLSLGYPTQRLRRLRDVDIPGAELAPLFVEQHTHPAYGAAATLASKLWHEMLDCDFNDTRWEQAFAACP